MHVFEKVAVAAAACAFLAVGVVGCGQETKTPAASKSEHPKSEHPAGSDAKKSDHPKSSEAKKSDHPKPDHPSGSGSK